MLRARWRRLLAEGIVIVASILLAFGIDAWWDSRGEAAQARALVTALSEDFTTTRQRFADSRDAYETVLESAEHLLTYAEAGHVPEAQWPRVDTLLSHVFYSMTTFEPPMGAVEAILTTGRLDLFQNRELLGELTRWTSTLEDLKVLEQAGSDHFFHTVYPYLATRLNLQDLDKAIPWQVPWRHDPTQAAALISHREFQNVLYMHYVLYHNIVGKLDAIDEAIGRVSALTERELRR